MHLIERFWTTVTYVVSIFTLSSVDDPTDSLQAPLLPSDGVHSDNFRGPIFKPPGGIMDGPGADFVCDYSAMKGVTTCSTPTNRQCWLQNATYQWNVSTNYEDISLTPIGVNRTYTMTLYDKNLNLDGIYFPYGKFFDGIYPGPWIQGCWGDNITVTIKNALTYNGTSVHWHGIRQWLTMHMDGVNGVTQCPIAPADSFTYTFRAMQYGSSWYHSHYSVQYADGAAGPMTLHGPSTANYDEPADLPILMTDWYHNSAFNASSANGSPDIPSILLNGAGNVTRFNNNITQVTDPPPPYLMTFDPPTQSQAKRYLLRIINTSFDSTFVFSIDNHTLQVVEADFVPIQPYVTESILVGIGQRYEAIVIANDPVGKKGNYWIRTWKANCFGFNQNKASPGYSATGILTYSGSGAYPNTTPFDVPLNCSDEPYDKLIPWYQWTTIGSPANDPTGGIGQNFTVLGEKSPAIYPDAFFSLGGDTYNPLKIDYADPTFLNLNFTGQWPPLWVIFPENYTSTDWVWMVIKSSPTNQFGAHPIHLHGHDFAILQQIENATFPAGLNITTNNPPRRDVVLLPNNGYVIIAFKTDNPGSWLMHCHIADHASSGLALQILERQQDAANIWPSLEKSHAIQVANAGCQKWQGWWGNCDNWWSPDGKSGCNNTDMDFAPDSGI